MPRINWNQVDRAEEQIENDDSLTPAEKSRLINELHREVRDEYREQQRDQERDEFGW